MWPYELIVFDLDFTLWTGSTWCDATCPPYRLKGQYVSDSEGNVMFLFPDVIEILETLKKEGIKMALASRTRQPLWAKELMGLFKIDGYFDYKEIYPGPKTEHFNQLHHISQIPFEKMVFFDDEMRNVSDVAELGVETHLVDEGISKLALNKTMGIKIGA